MSKKQNEPKAKRVIEQKWLLVLEELNKQLEAKGHSAFMRDSHNRPVDISTYDNEQIEWLELTAIASTKDRDALDDVASISYEEDEDCDSDEIEKDMLRSRQKWWEFEVEPLDRNHPQIALQNGFIAAKDYETAKAILVALPDKE